MTYHITNYSYSKAKILYLHIQTFKYKNKKIEIYKNNIFICSIGDKRYSDYPTYLSTHNLEYANKRRSLYHQRHNKLHTAGYYAYHLLW